MVLLIKFPKLKASTHWVEQVFGRKYKLKKINLDRFTTGAKAKELTGYSESRIIRILAKNKKYHAVVWNGELLIEPKAFIYILKKKFKAAISKELREYAS